MRAAACCLLTCAFAPPPLAAPPPRGGVVLLSERARDMGRLGRKVASQNIVDRGEAETLEDARWFWVGKAVLLNCRVS